MDDQVETLSVGKRKSDLEVTAWQLSGGPFCGIHFSCTVLPNLVLLFTGMALHGHLQNAELEAAYEKRHVRYKFHKVVGKCAIYRFDGTFTPIGEIGKAGDKP